MIKSMHIPTALQMSIFMINRCIRRARCRLHGDVSVAAPAAAQDKQEKYPERSIRVIIPFAAGSASDVVGRIVLDRMADDLGHRFVIDNQAGASGNLGTGCCGARNAGRLHHPRFGIRAAGGEPGPVLQHGL